jgi:hypothetical protein
MKATLALALFTVFGCTAGLDPSSVSPPSKTDTAPMPIGADHHAVADSGIPPGFIDASPPASDSYVSIDTTSPPTPADSMPASDSTVDANGASDLQTTVPCAGDYECAAGETCDMPCGLASGICREIPNNCFGAPKMQEECGCDGITYYNGCYRLMAGRGIAHLGECDIKAAETTICGDNMSCPAGTTCTRRVSDSTQCSLAPLMTNGTCWAFPENCIPSLGPFYRPCGTGSCESFCSLAKTTNQIYPCP